MKLLSKALPLDSGIKFETPIAHLILRTPTALIIGDSSLLACSGYSITLEFWWHLSFPMEVVERTRFHLKNNSDEYFISISCLKFVTIILNYCASLVVFKNCKVNDDPHPVVLCVTNNTSALDQKTSGSNFCGLLIGSTLASMQSGLAQLRM